MGNEVGLRRWLVSVGIVFSLLIRSHWYSILIVDAARAWLCEYVLPMMMHENSTIIVLLLKILSNIDIMHV
jgi:hypothetical protein